LIGRRTCAFPRAIVMVFVYSCNEYSQARPIGRLIDMHNKDQSLARSQSIRGAARHHSGIAPQTLLETCRKYIIIIIIIIASDFGCGCIRATINYI